MNKKHPKSIDLSKTTVPWIKQLNEKTLPPLTNRDFAIYVSAETGGIDPRVREREYQIVDAPEVSFEGTFSFTDPNSPEHGPILCKNISRRDAVAELDPNSGQETGRILNKENIDPILFTLGIVGVNMRTELIKYVFMELHPGNGNNPHRDRTKQPLFFRQDIMVKGDVSRYLEADMGLEAELAVKNMSHKEVLEKCASIVPPIPHENRKPGDVQLDLRVFARQHPKQFMMAIRNSKNVVQFLVAEGQDKGHLVFNNEVKAWFFFGAEEPFFNASKVNTNPVKALVDYMNSEAGEEDRKVLEALVNYWVV